jgi:hypothetical protein
VEVAQVQFHLALELWLIQLNQLDYGLGVLEGQGLQAFGLVQQGVQYFLIPGSQGVGGRSDFQLTVFGHGEAHYVMGQARPFVLQVFFEVGVNPFHFFEHQICLEFMMPDH